MFLFPGESQTYVHNISLKLVRQEKSDKWPEQSEDDMENTDMER